MVHELGTNYYYINIEMFRRDEKKKTHTIIISHDLKNSRDMISLR